MSTDTSKLSLAFPCPSLCYIRPTLFLQSFSEQTKCASPGKKGHGLQNQTAQVELSTERGYYTGPGARLGRGEGRGIEQSAAHKEYSDS